MMLSILRNVESENINSWPDLLNYTTSTLLQQELNAIVTMPVPAPAASQADCPLFPNPPKTDIDAARLSSWYPLFRRLTFPSTVIDLDAIGEKGAFLEVSTVWKGNCIWMQLMALVVAGL
jgi:hypothetical protein